MKNFIDFIEEDGTSTAGVAGAGENSDTVPVNRVRRVTTTVNMVPGKIHNVEEDTKKEQKQRLNVQKSNTKLVPAKAEYKFDLKQVGKIEEGTDALPRDAQGKLITPEREAHGGFWSSHKHPKGELEWFPRKETVVGADGTRWHRTVADRPTPKPRVDKGRTSKGKAADILGPEQQQRHQQKLEDEELKRKIKQTAQENRLRKLEAEAQKVKKSPSLRERMLQKEGWFDSPKPKPSERYKSDNTIKSATDGKPIDLDRFHHYVYKFYNPYSGHYPMNITMDDVKKATQQHIEYTKNPEKYKKDFNKEFAVGSFEGDSNDREHVKHIMLKNGHVLLPDSARHNINEEQYGPLPGQKMEDYIGGKKHYEDLKRAHNQDIEDHKNAKEDDKPWFAQAVKDSLERLKAHPLHPNNPNPKTSWTDYMKKFKDGYDAIGQNIRDIKQKHPKTTRAAKWGARALGLLSGISPVFEEKELLKFKVGQKVHAGLGTKGGIGFNGTIVKIEGNHAHVRSDHDSTRVFKAHFNNITSRGK